MYNKPLTIAATTLLLCSPVMILTSCEGKKESAGQMPALVPEVQVTKLVTRDVPIRQEWVGTLRGTEDAEIRSQVTGYLLSKDYKDGAYVKKGQVLFQIDPRPFQATLDQAQGRLEQYEATLKKYKLDVERYTPLVKTGSVSRKQLDDALQQVQETEPDPDLRFFTVLVFLGQQGTIVILIQETGQGLFGGIRHNRADGIRITEGRIEDTPPVVSFSFAYFHPHRVVGAAGKYHVAVGF